MINILTQKLLFAATEHIKQRDSQWIQQQHSIMKAPIMAGTIFGPFLVRLVDAEEFFPDTFTIYDSNGRARRFRGLGLECALFAQFCRPLTPTVANSSAILTDNSQLYIIMRRTIRDVSELCPILINWSAVSSSSAVRPTVMTTTSAGNSSAKKQFECSDCALGFTNRDTLTHHRAFYCRRLNEKIDTENSDASSRVLILPIAYCGDIKSNDSMTNYQILAPISIHRDKATNTNELQTSLIDFAIEPNVATRPDFIATHATHCNASTSANCADDTPLDLRTRKRFADEDECVPALKHQKYANVSSVNNGRRLLDVTRRAVSQPSAAANTPEAKPPVSRRYACKCGVSFLVRETYEGHRRYYCKIRATDHVDIDNKNMETIASTQQLCVAHAAIAKAATPRCFICQLCGYKSYSERGIRNHLRVAHDAPLSAQTALISYEAD